MKKIILSLLLLTAFMYGCNSKTNKQEQPQITADNEPDKIPVLEFSDFNNSTKSPGTFTWNELSNSIRLVPLETNSKSLLTESSYPEYISEQLIIISDARSNKVHIFGGNGKYINTISKQGNGPDEYIYLTHIHYNETDSTINIFDNNNQRIISYDLNGKSRKVVSTAGIFEGNIVLTGKNNFVIQNRASDYQINYFDLDWNKTGDELPHLTAADQRTKSITFISSGRSRNSKDIYVVNNVFNDTIFSFSEITSKPLAIWKKRNQKLPVEEISNYLQYLQKPNDYILPRSIDFFSHYLLIRYILQGKMVTELWDINDEQLIANHTPEMSDGEKAYGFPYELSSGKKILLLPRYLTSNKIAFMIPADEIAGEIPHVKTDDNPVLLIIDLNE